MNTVNEPSANPTSILAMTSTITTAYLAANPISPDELPNLIKAVHASLAGLGQPETPRIDEQRQTPAVPIRKSVRPDHIACLEDGKKLKMLKRHLKTVYDLTPEEYRAKWNLPVEYPMVAPNYAAKRSELAKGFGLGRKRTNAGGADRRQAA